MKRRTIVTVIVMTAMLILAGMPAFAASKTPKAEAAGKVQTFSAKKPSVEEVDYDGEDREVNFEFRNRVKWKKPKVKILDSNGKNYVTRIKEKDNDEIEVKVKKLKYGKKYTYKISGVASKGSNSYKAIKGSFKARRDD